MVVFPRASPGIEYSQTYFGRTTKSWLQQKNILSPPSILCCRASIPALGRSWTTTGKTNNHDLAAPGLFHMQPLYSNPIAKSHTTRTRTSLEIFFGSNVCHTDVVFQQTDPPKTKKELDALYTFEEQLQSDGTKLGQ